MTLLDGEALTIAQVSAIARANEPVGLAAHAMDAMRRSRSVVERLAAGEDPVYAVNTGVGLLADVRVPTADLQALRSEEHTSELQSHSDLVCRLLLEKKNTLHKHQDELAAL